MKKYILLALLSAFAHTDQDQKNLEFPGHNKLYGACDGMYFTHQQAKVDVALLKVFNPYMYNAKNLEPIINHCVKLAWEETEKKHSASNRLKKCQETLANKEASSVEQELAQIETNILQQRGVSADTVDERNQLVNHLVNYIEVATFAQYERPLELCLAISHYLPDGGNTQDLVSDYLTIARNVPSIQSIEDACAKLLQKVLSIEIKKYDERVISDFIDLVQKKKGAITNKDSVLEVISIITTMLSSDVIINAARWSAEQMLSIVNYFVQQAKKYSNTCLKRDYNKLGDMHKDVKWLRFIMEFLQLNMPAAMPDNLIEIQFDLVQYLQIMQSAKAVGDLVEDYGLYVFVVNRLNLFDITLPGHQPWRNKTWNFPYIMFMMGELSVQDSKQKSLKKFTITKQIMIEELIGEGAHCALRGTKTISTSSHQPSVYYPISNMLQVKILAKLTDAWNRVERLEVSYSSGGPRNRNDNSFKPGMFVESDVVDVFFGYYQTNSVITVGIVTRALTPNTAYAHDNLEQALNYIHSFIPLNVNVLVIPLADGYHWTLLVAEKSSKTLTIVDSMYGSSQIARQVLTKLWVSASFADMFAQWRADVFSTHLQTDGSSCGIHALVYATVIARFGKLDRDEIMSLTNSRVTIENLLYGDGAKKANYLAHEVRGRSLFNDLYRSELKAMIANEDVRM